MPLILPSNSISALGYEVSNSLRFDDGSADDLVRSKSASETSTQKGTFSFWFKRSAGFGTQQYLYGNEVADDNNRGYIVFQSNETFRIVDTSGGSNHFDLVTTQLFRDVSAWYHIVIAIDTTQATSSNRAKLYVNGNQVTAFGTETYPSQNANLKIFEGGQTNKEKIGGLTGQTSQLDGYLAEYVLIDGTQNSVTDFGEFDEDSLIWKPIDVSGLTFGTNGFYLDFENSGSLGADVSGNGNNFTVNNLTSIDQTTDTPTNNYCTMSQLTSTQNFNLSNGNLKLGAAADNQALAGTIAGTVDNATYGYYFEYKVNASNLGSSGEGFRVGILNANDIMKTSASARVLQIVSPDLIYETATNGGAGVVDTDIGSAANGDIVMVAWKNGKVWFGVNGIWVNSGNPSAGTGEQFSGLSGDYVPWIMCSLVNGVNGSEFNFGNPVSTISSGNSDANGYGNFEYAVPSGYYALNTKNLAEYG